MEIQALSGATVSQLHEEDLLCMVESGQSVKDLKKLLASRIGYSRFRQRLVSEELGELQDDMPVRQLPILQLVILDFCAPEHANWEALLLACQNNRVVEVEQLLQKPLDPNSRSTVPRRRWPISSAAERGYLEVVRLLLEAGADQNVAALMLAAYNGHLEVVRVLLEARANIYAKKQDGATALMMAAGNGHLEVVWVLLEARANMYAKKQDGTTALMMAVEGGHLEVVKLFLDAGADGSRAAMQDGLMLAAFFGNLEVVRVFIKADKYAMQEGALMFAVFSGHTQVVRVLLEAGADQNAMFIMKEWSHTRVVRMLWGSLELGAELDGTTALMMAVERGYLEVVRVLLEGRADIYAKRQDGTTALMLAAGNGHLEVVRVLLEGGAEKNAAMPDGATALMMAAENGHLEVVRLLR